MEEIDVNFQAKNPSGIKLLNRLYDGHLVLNDIGVRLDEQLRNEEELTVPTQEDVNNFNSQYPLLEVRYTKVFHDRFLILDKKNVYHIGASLKDAGKKCFGISLIEDAGIVRDILQRLEIETEE